jgi:hypothetical protein
MSKPAASNTVQAKAWFEPSAYRSFVADAFSGLDREAQREFADRLQMLPRHIHSLALQGLIADGVKG